MTETSNATYPIYIGWIYGDSEDRARLEKLGVKGEMIWRTHSNLESRTVTARRKRGIFEHCECTEETLDKLGKEYPAFWRGSFTKADGKAYRKYRQQFGEATDAEGTG